MSSFMFYPSTDKSTDKSLSQSLDSLCKMMSLDLFMPFLLLLDYESWRAKIRDGMQAVERPF